MGLLSEAKQGDLMLMADKLLIAQEFIFLISNSDPD
jgi:hypothetical protein